VATLRDKLIQTFQGEIDVEIRLMSQAGPFPLFTDASNMKKIQALTRLKKDLVEKEDTPIAAIIQEWKKAAYGKETNYQIISDSNDLGLNQLAAFIEEKLDEFAKKDLFSNPKRV
jgi:regulator of extracellular matrix RemA (YlzA/DUF370 family)